MPDPSASGRTLDRFRAEQHDQGGRAEPAPDWPATKPFTLEACLAAFDRLELSFTVGVEEELMVVDRDSLELAPAAGELLTRLPSDGQFRPELHASQLELITRVAATAADARRELGSLRQAALFATGEEVGLLACGCHPLGAGRPTISPGDRYREIAGEHGWAADHSLTCGLHVHVAVAGAARSLAVFNALRSYLPEFAALGANSVFAEGRDTGLVSIRSKISRLFPRVGIPPVLETWGDYVALVTWGRAGGLFPDASYLWWDLRPSPAFGTLEVRVLDSQSRLDDVAALTAVVQAVVAWLAERFDEGERLPVHDSHRIAENAWRAHRNGLLGFTVDLDTGERIPTQEHLAILFEEIEPVAARLGAENELDWARTLLAGNGADRQRAIAEREGVEGLVRRLVQETENVDR